MKRGNDHECALRDKITEFYDAYGARLFAYVHSLVGDPEEAEDIVQEVFVKIFAGRRMPDDLAAYLFRAARNTAYSRLRWRWIRMRLHPAVKQHMTLFQHDGSSQEEWGNSAQQAMNQLPLNQREVVMLKIWQGFTFQEMARVIGCSHNTAASRYRYAIKRLRCLLDKTGTWNQDKREEDDA